MSSSDIAVSVRGLSKRYTIAHQGEKHSTLAETLLAKARNPFQRTQKETFWALKDVNFDIKKGEVVGIIGRNGAGKSTLLKILSRITEPTAGQIDLYGRVGSLLEVGTGFHPELTGRENIFLNGAILGMTKAEIRKQFDAIVDFAGVEKFLDTPVKRYSSGMYVRLAFAVAAHLNPEILIIDEVLAVGDASFQQKCIGKMRSVSQNGRTILFVSHSAAAIQALCNKVVVLQAGEISKITDNVSNALSTYLYGDNSEAASNVWISRSSQGSEDSLQLKRFAVSDASESDRDVFHPHETLKVTIDVDICSNDPALTFGYAVWSTDKVLLYYSLITDAQESSWPTRTAGCRRYESLLPSNFFNTGDYKIEFIASFHRRQWIYELGRESVLITLRLEGPIVASPLWIDRREGLTAPRSAWLATQPTTPMS